MNIEDITKQILIEGQLGLTPIAQTTQRVVQILKKHNVTCALVGGYAVYLYGYARYTNDVDFVVKQRNEAKEILLANGFKSIPGNNMSIKDIKTGVLVDLLQTGTKDSPNAIPYPKSTNTTDIRLIPVINLLDLLIMKLSSYHTSGIKRLSDLSDVTKLISINNLSHDYIDQCNYEPIIKLYHSVWTGLKNGL